MSHHAEDQADDQADDQKGQQTDQDGNTGQVSEVAAGGGGGPEPISAGDSVAGQPDDESGEVQEGAQGPNSIPEDETDEHPHQTT